MSDRLTDEELDAWSGAVWMDLNSLRQARRMAVELIDLRRNGPLWLQHAIASLHSQVDLTDPNDPIGAALTRAGLERWPTVLGSERRAADLTRDDVMVLGWLRGWSDVFGHKVPSKYEDTHKRALAAIDKILAAHANNRGK